MSLANKTKVIRVINATAAGVTNITSSIVDTAGFQGVRFVVAMGATLATSVTSIKVQDGNVANLSDAADVAGTGLTITPTTDDNAIWVIDIFRPVKRYCTVNVLRATANATIDGAIAELYDGRNYPEALDATTHGQKLLSSPADGTP